MSGILLRWLNEDLVLRQRVFNLEHDFSNGYLLGEILHIHNHQSNFDLFQESSTSEAKTNNFILLEPSLRLLAIPFDAQTAYNIMQQTPGMAGRVLYQLKMVLDRLTKFAVPVSMRAVTTVAEVKPLPNLQQRTTKAQYDRATHAIFVAAVRDMVQSQKGITLERSLQRFAAEGARQKRLVEIEKERSLLAEELHTEAIRAQGLHDLAQRKAFCNSWEETNVDEWLINMSRKEKRELRNRRYSRKVERARLTRLQRVRTAGEKVVQYDIPEYEARARDTILTASNNQDEHEATPWALTASTRGFLEARALDKGFEWQMGKFHSKRSEERTGVREKRRRRFTTEREESRSNEHLQERANALKEKLMKRCHAEELVERELDSVFRYKAIMTENRLYRTEQYAARADVDAEGLLKRDQASLDSARRVYELDVKAHMRRCEDAAKMRTTAAAARTEKMCRETLNGIVALSIQVAKYRAYSEHIREPKATAPHQDPMPRLQWKDMKWSFIRGGPLVRMDTANSAVAREWGRTQLLVLAVGEGEDDLFGGADGNTLMAEEVASFLDHSESRTYINGTGSWAARSKTPAELVGKEHDIRKDDDERKGHGVVETVTADLEPQSESAALPQAVTTGNVLGTDNPLHGLGECVVEVSVAAYPLSAPLPPPAIPKFSLRICMCGKTLTGKSEQAIRLGDRYCLKVLSAEELAQVAMDNAANSMAAGRKTLTRNEALGQEARSALLRGATISDRVYAALLVEAIKGIEVENQATQFEETNARGNQAISSNEDRSQYMGWIIDDFPSTAEQAMVFEKHLSGYDEAVRESSRRDAVSNLAPVAPAPPDENSREKGPILSGIDLVLFLEVPRETVLKRSLGRLFDPVTSEAYHFEGLLPQYDVVCKERLVRPEDPANSSVQLSLQVSTQEKSLEELKSFLARFGTLRVVDSGEGTPDALFGKLNAVVVAMLREVREPDGVDVVHRATLQTDATIHQSDAGDSAGVSPDAVTGPEAKLGENQVVDSSTDQGFTSGGAEEVSGSAASSSTALGSAAVTGDGECSDAGQGGGRALKGVLAVAMAGHWRAAEAHFEETARQVFRELRNQRLLVGVHFRSLRDSFSLFLNRLDDKQSVLAEFCSSFNAIDQDVRFDDRARKELLLRVEECRSKLWFDVEQRKACATETLTRIEENGWLERQEGMTSNHIMVLMQAEVERFHAGMLLLHDYHHCRTQGLAGDDTPALVPLLPPENVGNASTETSAAKPGAKKDKDVKGSGKKVQEGKGGKGTKASSLGDSPSAAGFGVTAFPPCLILPSLVDVVTTGAKRKSSLAANEAAAAGTPEKGKAEKGKKLAPKKLAGKTDVPESEAMKTSVAAALDVVVEYANAWGPEGFPVPVEEETPDVHVGSHGSFDSVQQRNLRLLHRAVWAQADLLASRSRLLLTAGEEISWIIQQKADLVHSELQKCLDVRTMEEAKAVEAAMKLAAECIDTQAPIEHEWDIQGVSFHVDRGTWLVQLPDDRPGNIKAAETLGSLSEAAAPRLEDTLRGIEHVGRGPHEARVVSPEDLIDVLMRLCAEEGQLPACWAGISKAGWLQLATSVLDPDDTGQIEVEQVLSAITTKTPEQILLHSN